MENKAVKLKFEKVNQLDIPVALIIETDNGEERVITYMNIPIENIDISNSGFINLTT